MTATSEPFSVMRMRASLYLFAGGKVISGLIGIAWLLTLIRALGLTHSLALNGVAHLIAAGATIAIIYYMALSPVSSGERAMLFRLLPARWQR